MAGYRTHMLIGAVGGLGAYRITEYVAPAQVIFRLNIGGSTFVVPSLVVGLASAVVSMYMALWPDIDERGSRISNRAPRYMWLWALMLAFCFAVSVTQSVLVIVGLCLIGAIAGRIGVGVFLYILRVASGGHRHLTHSLVLATILFIGSGVFYVGGLPAMAMPAFALAWGQIMHLVGDVVTPGGVPLFYPLSSRDIHLFPYAISRYGELLIACLSFVAGIFFIIV